MFLIFSLVVNGVDQVVLSHSLQETLVIVILLGFRVEGQGVLIKLLASNSMTECVVLAVLKTPRMLRLEFPVVLGEVNELLLVLSLSQDICGAHIKNAKSY